MNNGLPSLAFCFPIHPLQSSVFLEIGFWVFAEKTNGLVLLGRTVSPKDNLDGEAGAMISLLNCSLHSSVNSTRNVKKTSKGKKDRSEERSTIHNFYLEN